MYVYTAYICAAVFEREKWVSVKKYVSGENVFVKSRKNVSA